MRTIYVKLQNFDAHIHRFVSKKTLLLSKTTNNFLMTYDGYCSILLRSIHFSENHLVFFDRFPLFDEMSNYNEMLHDFKLVRRNNALCDAINRRAFHIPKTVQRQAIKRQNYNEINLYVMKCNQLLAPSWRWVWNLLLFTKQEYLEIWSIWIYLPLRYHVCYNLDKFDTIEC